MIPRQPKGFIALMSAIFISVILLLIASSGSFTGLYGRFNALDSELKERSSALAEACVDTARINLANDSTYTGSQSVALGESVCTIGPVQNNTPVSGQKTFTTQGIVTHAYTNLKVVVKSSDISVVSWTETPL